jgi:hypothetical protein
VPHAGHTRRGHLAPSTTRTTTGVRAAIESNGYRRTTRTLAEIQAIREQALAPDPKRVAALAAAARRRPRRRALDEEHARLLSLAAMPGLPSHHAGGKRP